MTRAPFLAQDGGTCCALYALCNAARFLGIASPDPGSQEWEDLVDLTSCHNGPAVRVFEAAALLGLRMTRVAADCVEAPAFLTVVNPDPNGCWLHACLFIGRAGAGMRLVNYSLGEPAVETVHSIRWPRWPNARHYNIRELIR